MPTLIIDNTGLSSNNGTATTEESSGNLTPLSNDDFHRKNGGKVRKSFNQSSSVLSRGSVLSRFHIDVDTLESRLEKEISKSQRDADVAEQEVLLVIDSIRWMSGHIPRCVLQDLTRHAMLSQKKIMPKMPYAQTYRAALLFIDMSGFTKLSQLLDVESLSKNINMYFQKIINEVTLYGGDVLKFAGDAIFAEWRIDEEVENKIDATFNIHQCVHFAASCGASVVAKCSDFPVLSGYKEQVATLNVHCGLGFGKMSGVHVGNDCNRRDYIVFGNPIDQVSKACDVATHGQLMSSPEAYEILMQQQTSSRRKRFFRQKKIEKTFLIASRGKCFFKNLLLNRSSRKKGNIDIPPKNDVVIPFNKMDRTSLQYLQKLVSLYVHPVVLSDLTSRRDSGDKGMISRRYSANGTKIQAQHRSEAEIRSVYTIFVKVLVQPKVKKSGDENDSTFELLNQILKEVVTLLDNFKAHLRQFIVDDKGVILIATFGLRGSTFPNMASERVLPACRMIHYALQNDLGVDNFIGATFGKAYCGVVGSVTRHDFAVMGPSVNLAARLLAKTNHPGVLIDDSIRREAMDWGTFSEFPPMKAKGYKYLVPVFQPISATESRWGKVNPHFVGRRPEMKQVSIIAQEMSMSEGPSRIFFVWGESGSGKSDFLVQTVSQVRRMIFTSRRQLILTRNVGNEGDVLIPFSAFRSIFKDLLGESFHIENNRSKSQLEDRIPSENYLEVGSVGSSSTFSTVNTAKADRLHDLCSELGAPKALLRIVGYHLLGLSFNASNSKDKIPKLDEIIEFMAQLFIHSTLHADLTIVALDDLQYIDDLSWKVVLKIFEISNNILFLCASRPYMFVKEGFLKEITSSTNDSTRFQQIEIGPLQHQDITRMVSLVLDIKIGDVDKSFVKDLYDHTRGMPNFALEVLKTCKARSMFVRLDNNKVGLPTGTAEYSSLRDLMLQRIDGFDDFTRKTLHCASILGHTFSFKELLALSEEVFAIRRDMKNDHQRKIENSVNIVVKEGIIDDNAPLQSASAEFFSMQKISISSFADEEKDFDDVSTYDKNERCFQFCHDAWRQAILSLLLDSFKKDMHMYAARSIESRIDTYESADYHTKIKLFIHLKLSGDKCKATSLALSAGENFMELNLNLQSIFIYNEALDMWREKKLKNEVEFISGIPSSVIQSLDQNNLKSVVRLLIALGQALGTTLTRKAESASAFEDALQILKKCSSTSELKDRSFIFPVFSGLFFLLKLGGLIAVDEEKEYEQNLVSDFVEETRLHGDPVHYSRALAMQSEIFARQGNFIEALKSHEKLKEVYDVKKHSALVMKKYQSDRSAQNFAVSANYLYRLGKVEEALRLCDNILENILPQMDLRNVHNSFVMTYPLLWILKNERMPKRAVWAFEKYVLDPFYYYYGENGKTYSLRLFKPIRILFSIAMFINGDVKKFNDDAFSWALEENSLNLGYSFNKSMVGYGRCGSSVCSEICLLLSKQTNNEDVKTKLITKGWDLVQEAMEIATQCGKSQMAFVITKPIYDELSVLITDLHHA